MTLYETVTRMYIKKLYGDENYEPRELFIVDDRVDRLTNSEFLILLSAALEKMKDDSKS